MQRNHFVFLFPDLSSIPYNSSKSSIGPIPVFNNTKDNNASAQDADIAACAGAALDHLLGAPEELMRFMSACGYTPDTLRASVGTPELHRALVDHFAAHEPLLLALCANGAISQRRFMDCWQRMNRQDR